MGHTLTPTHPKPAASILEGLANDVRRQLGDAGLAVVPLTPTPRMLEAGKLAGTGDQALAKAIYAAMMDAAT